MKKYNVIMERFWMLMAVVSFIYAVYMIGAKGIIEAGIYLIFPFVAGMLSYMRYFTRKRIEKGEAEKAETDKAEAEKEK